ncbi:putative mutated in ataxia telangiectasia [Operophtera brumata]|uniref:Putative mutated in ataxia telangiectasia n=1 Tax=Operophtera brumata TaxID=104452 RepID=A0A0L7LUR2_OPEBR|nr:putative mutated in ataxia telangiectasia [Operophtera brumata]
MALETSLRELSDGLRSSRVTDRKKNAENLKEFLTRNAVPSLLTENTMKKKGKAFIKVDKITEACLQILRDGRLRKAIELLDVCLSACLSTSSKLDNFTKLRLVLLIMRNAKNYCQFVSPLRESLTKFKKCVIKVAHDKKAQEVIIEIMILLLETPINFGLTQQTCGAVG